MIKQFVLFCFLFLMCLAAFAQCPMCGEAARTSLNQGNNTALGLNTGILMLLAGPYLLVMAGGYIWYRNRKKAKAIEAENLNHTNL